MNSRHPINGAADFAGLRIRASAGALQVKGFELLGASAIQLPSAKSPLRCQRGLIDGVFTSVAAAAAGKLGEQAKYVNVTRQQFFNPAIIVNLDWWNKISKATRDAILAAMPAFTDGARQINLDDETKSLEALKSQGAEVIELKPDAEAAIKDTLQPLYTEYRPKIGEDLYDRAKEAVDAAK